MGKASWRSRRVALLPVLVFWSSSGAALPSSVPRLQTVEVHGSRSLAFEENRGQTGAEVRYLARGDGYGLFLTSSEAVLVLRSQNPKEALRTLRLRWLDAAGDQPVAVTAEGLLAAKAHLLKGSDPSKWVQHIPIFSRIRYSGLYPGIDLVFYGREGTLEYDFVLAPGADPERIHLSLEGAERLEVSPEGHLIVTMEDGEVRFRHPVSYQAGQDVNGTRREVKSRYRLLPPQPGESGWRLGFEVGAYDSQRPLVIDPMLIYSTYLGGSQEDQAGAITVDAAGNAYVTGYTITYPDFSSDFPLTPDAFQKLASWIDVFVTKLDPSGALVYSTLLGGEVEDEASGIVVDAAGNAYVVGSTASPDFPRVNPLQPGPEDYTPDAFVAKLDSAGASLLFSTTLGGSFADFGGGIGLDARGQVYVTGTTDSADFPQPGSPPPPGSASGELRHLRGQAGSDRPRRGLLADSGR